MLSFKKVKIMFHVMYSRNHVERISDGIGGGGAVQRGRGGADERGGRRDDTR